MNQAPARTLLLAVLVGGATGLTGGVFRRLIETSIEWRAASGEFFHTIGAPQWAGPALLSALMLLGAVSLVRRFAPEAAGSGVQEIEGALDGLRPVRWPRVLPVKFIGGILSLGSGLVAGREGPTIQMGGALGRMLSDGLGASEEDAHIVTASGAGAGLAAAFNAPLAGVLFVLEEMRPQFHYGVVSVIAVLVACAASDAVVRMILGDGYAIVMPSLAAPDPPLLWLFLLFGVVVGGIGVVFNATILRTLDLFESMGARLNILAVATLGLVVGVMTVQAPDLVGGGYRVVGDVLSGVHPAGVLAGVFVFRFFATSLSYATGAPGGIFAPMVALGTLLGMLFGRLFVIDVLGIEIEPTLFAVAGMGALFAATVRAPITGIVLTVEMTGSYGQTLPLMVVCSAAVVTAHLLGGSPIYSLLLERRLRLDATA